MNIVELLINRVVVNMDILFMNISVDISTSFNLNCHNH